MGAENCSALPYNICKNGTNFLPMCSIGCASIRTKGSRADCLSCDACRNAVRRCPLGCTGRANAPVKKAAEERFPNISRLSRSCGSLSCSPYQWSRNEHLLERPPSLCCVPLLHCSTHRWCLQDRHCADGSILSQFLLLSFTCSTH